MFYNWCHNFFFCFIAKSCFVWKSRFSGSSINLSSIFCCDIDKSIFSTLPKVGSNIVSYLAFIIVPVSYLQSPYQLILVLHNSLHLSTDIFLPQAELLQVTLSLLIWASTFFCGDYLHTTLSIKIHFHWINKWVAQCFIFWVMSYIPSRHLPAQI